VTPRVAVVGKRDGVRFDRAVASTEETFLMRVDEAHVYSAYREHQVHFASHQRIERRSIALVRYAYYIDLGHGLK
jgi:hypothetical protein